MPPPRDRRLDVWKPFLWLGVFLAVWYVLPTVVKSFYRAAFYEVQAPAYVASSYLHDLQNYWAVRSRSKLELMEAARDLQRLNNAYELRLQENRALRTEIERLEELLGLPSHPEYRYEPARIIRRDLTAWWHTLIIRKGAGASIPEGAAVVYAGGVVGRVKEVRATTAVVELLSSPTFRMAAHMEGDERPITYQGSGSPAFDQPRGVVRNVPTDIVATPSQPRRVVSTRLGGVFPDGLTIGEVSNLEQTPDGLFQRGVVRLGPDLDELREVAVLVPVDPERTDAPPSVLPAGPEAPAP